jgi:hypothetical protein
MWARFLRFFFWDEVAPTSGRADGALGEFLMDRTFHASCVVLMASLSVCQAAEPISEKESAAIKKVVTASTQATQKRDWDALAALIHPDSLKDFKDMFVPVLQAAAKKGDAEQTDLLSMFDGAKDLKTVLAWEPKHFFASFAKGFTSKAPLNVPLVSGTIPVLGMVMEGADQVHVVVRATRTIGKTKFEFRRFRGG